MKTLRDLAEVRSRLEIAVAQLPDPPDANDAQAVYDRYEEIAIQVLDGGFGDFRENELETYLKAYLYLKSLELGLCEFQDTIKR